MLENLNVAQRIEVPKDFRPAFEFDGENGSATLPAIPAGQVPDFDSFLLEQGFDPKEYEIVGSPRTSRWQKYDETWLTSYRFNFRKLNQGKELSLLYKHYRSNIKLAKPSQKDSEKALVVMLADFQLGKSDSRGSIEDQLERLAIARSALASQFKKGYSKIILAEMGDVIEGFYNAQDMQQSYTNSLSQMQQIDLALTILWDIVKLARSSCSDVIYASIASNHCQFRLNKQRVGLPGQDDWGIYIANQISRLSKETDLGIRVLVPNPQDESLAFDVFDDSFHVLGLWHGHQSNRPESVPSWWEKQAFGHQPVAAATIGLTGHFHHFRIQELGLASNGGSRYWIQGKTMDNGSSWFRLNQGQDSQPGLTCFELDKGKHFTGSVFHV